MIGLSSIDVLESLKRFLVTFFLTPQKGRFDQSGLMKISTELIEVLRT